MVEVGEWRRVWMDGVCGYGVEGRSGRNDGMKGDGKRRIGKVEGI